MTAPAPAVSVVIPNWNGRRWLAACLAALQAQQLPAREIIVVDNGSTDGSLEFLDACDVEVRVLALGSNTGFAYAANRGIEAAHEDLVALLNTDVVPARDWLARAAGALQADPQAAAVACKMVSLDDPREIYDAGDILRRDGACEQRGRFRSDHARWDEAGEVFGACAGAAVYRREVLRSIGGFDERYFAYLEDVDLALRIQLAGWRCLYVPAVVRHAGEGSSAQLSGAHHFYVARNTLLLVAKFFPLRWSGLVVYRQLSWLRNAWRRGWLGPHLRGLAAAVPMLPGALRARHHARPAARIPIEVAIPSRPFRGVRAGGHPLGSE